MNFYQSDASPSPMPMQTAKEKIRLVVVDDHKLVRSCLRLLLSESSEIEVVGEAASAQEGLALIRDLRPDVVLVDIGLPDMSGIELTSRIVATLPSTRVLVLSMYDNFKYVRSAFFAGAQGYLLKFVPWKKIERAIKTVAGGHCYLSEPLAVGQEDEVGNQALTERERDVLILVGKGLCSKSVAEQLGLGIRTVETHRLNLRRKLSIESPLGLVGYAMENGWIKVW